MKKFSANIIFTLSMLEEGMRKMSKKPRFFFRCLTYLCIVFTISCGRNDTSSQPTPTLDDYKKMMRDVLTLPNVIFLDADETCNCIVVGVSDLAQTSVILNYASTVNVPQASVQTVLTQPIVTFASLRDNIRPIKGGLQIQSDNGAFCTMMGTVYNSDRKTKGLLTNSHCTKSRSGDDGTKFFQSGGALFSSDYVAKEVVDPSTTSSIPGCPSGRTCRLSDVAYAEFDTSTIGIVGKIAKPSHMCMAIACDVNMNNSNDELNIKGIGGAPTNGQILHKVGRTTGWTTGEVARTCIDINVLNTTITMLCQHEVNAGVNRGDSGSPVFELLQNQDVVLMGILWGGLDDGSQFVFSDIPSIEQELGQITFFTP